jgi:hypothetical protein
MTNEMKRLIRMANTASVELMDRLPMYDRRLEPSLGQLMRAIAYLEWLVLVEDCKGGVA